MDMGLMVRFGELLFKLLLLTVTTLQLPVL